MRTFLTAFALTLVLVAGVLGWRGALFRRTPLEILPDMVRQPKLRSQGPSDQFADGRASRLPVEGAIPRASAIPTPHGSVYPHEDVPFNTGRAPGTTNVVEHLPLPMTEALLRRGQERFGIHCAPCHGPQGDGLSVVKRLGAAAIPSLHDKRIALLPDGGIFRTITEGLNRMPGYGASVTPADRWAVVAYLRALQLSHLGTTNDVPRGAPLLPVKTHLP